MNYQNVKTLSDSSTIFNKSFIVEIGQTSLPSFSLDFKQVPQANICPLFSRNKSVCSFILYFSSLISSISTPLFIKNTFTQWSAFNEVFPNLKAFQTTSATFVLITIPILI